MLGWFQKRPRLGLTFLALSALTFGWQGIGDIVRCPPILGEVWLRRQVDPTWDRDISLARLLAQQVTGRDASDTVFAYRAAVGGAMVVYAFLRYHLPSLRRWGKSRLRREAG